MWSQQGTAITLILLKNESSFIFLVPLKVIAVVVLTFGGRSSSLSQGELRSNFSSRLGMRGAGGGISEVGSEFCRGISGRWDFAFSWKAATPLEDWSCTDWDTDSEELWDLTGTRWAIWEETESLAGLQQPKLELTAWWKHGLHLS